MKYHFLFLFFIIQKIICQKICINCRFFLKNNNPEFGRCACFPKNIDNSIFLVTGKYDKNVEYYFCSTARTDEKMCGEQGKKYEEKK
jgi:hypothetical protein